MIVGCAIQAGSISYAMILVARVISGFGNGMLTSTIPAYQSECAKPARRGQLVLFEGSLITFVSRFCFLPARLLMPQGIAVAYWINVGFFFVPGSASWRFPTAFQLVSWSVLPSNSSLTYQSLALTPYSISLIPAGLCTCLSQKLA